MPTTPGGTPLTSNELQPCKSSERTRPQQLPLWPAVATAPVNPWRRAHRHATWLDVSRALPANLGIEFTADHGWRIVVVPLATRRALELLDVHEGDAIPDPVMREQRRRTVAAQLLLEQARLVLAAVQTELDTAWLEATG